MKILPNTVSQYFNMSLIFDELRRRFLHNEILRHYEQRDNKYRVDQVSLNSRVTTSAALNNFMQSYGKKSRVEATEYICKYIKDNNLNDPKSRRLIIPDEKLAELLGSREPLSYFQLQVKLVSHFGKDYPVVWRWKYIPGDSLFFF